MVSQDSLKKLNEHAPLGSTAHKCRIQDNHMKKIPNGAVIQIVDPSPFLQGLIKKNTDANGAIDAAIKKSDYPQHAQRAQNEKYARICEFCG